MRKTCVILNPAADNSQPGPTREALQRRSPDARQRYELYDTTRQERIMEAVITGVSFLGAGTIIRCFPSF